MAQPLPPLNSLRAFEAAGRLLSFTAAARELHVTTAAVSHQIKGLEKYLGLPLFRRTPRRLFLTEAGAAAWREIHEGFEHLRLGSEALRNPRDGGLVVVNVSPAFATRWLLPRLARFTVAHPAVALRLVTGTEPVNFEESDADLAVRFGHGRQDGAEARALFGECLAPLASPAALRAQPLRRAADLRRAALIHDDSTRRVGAGSVGWEDWLQQAGVDGVDGARGLRFDDGHLALQAAAAGAGVALGRLAYAADDLAAGRLVAPLAMRLPLEPGYWLLTPRGRPASPSVAAFTNWISDEASTFAARLDRLGRGGLALAPAGS
jgi:LysR family glycine cleavage system transcriptional activator